MGMREMSASEPLVTHRNAPLDRFSRSDEDIAASFEPDGNTEWPWAASKPVTSRRAAKKERHTPTTSRANATRNDAGSSRVRRLTPALWQVVTQEGRRRARVPQRRSDNK